MDRFDGSAAVRRKRFERKQPGSSRELGSHSYLRARLMLLIFVPIAVWYFSWLLQPERMGHPVLYVLLMGAELFNFIQVLGFWWTCSHDVVRGQPPPYLPRGAEVDVLIPVYGEPVEVVEPTVAAARRMSGAKVRVALLDDGPSLEMKSLAQRHGVRYLTRKSRSGAKAGNLNNALRRTSSEFVAIFDCDHVPDRRFLEETLPHFFKRNAAYVQTPQYYANASGRGGLCAAAWGQQALFFGPIARGKDRLDSMFCCGTNVIFRRSALETVDGFPESSLTEDFEMSIELHERGWRSVYVPTILARGLGPEDSASYVGQQHRWARGCLSSIPKIVTSFSSLKTKLQYLLSAGYFLTGISLAVYMSLPVIRLLTGAQPLEASTADQFLLHFAPYFGLAILSVARFGGGLYTFDSFALTAAYFWIHFRAAWGLLLRRPSGFTITPKKGAEVRQIRAAAPTLAVIALLVASSAYGLLRDPSPATWNNVAFAMLHTTVLMTGVWPALTRSKASAGADPRIVPSEEAAVETELPVVAEARTGASVTPATHVASGHSELLGPADAGPRDTADVDVIMLTWDRTQMALETIDNAIEQRGVSLHMWVIDQGSKPTGLRKLRERAARDGRISVIELGRNVGPPAGRNAGGSLGAAPYIVTIDNDAVFDDELTLYRIKERMDRDRDIGVLACRILNFTSGKEESWSYPQSMRALAHQEFPAARFVTCGAAIRRAAFEEAGGFDENLFFCEEELDLSLKILDIGYRIVYDPKATVLHKVAPERRVKWDEDRFYFQTRNALYLDYKHYRQPGRTLTLAIGYLTKSFYNRVPEQALRGMADAVAMTRRDGRHGRRPPLSEAARRYVRVNEESYRNGLLKRVKNEVLVKMRGIK